jgi:hypothetical protein
MEHPVYVDSNTEIHAYAALLRRRRQDRQRRRAFALGAFLLLGLALGTIWASGFATTGGATGTASKAETLFADPGNKQDTSGLNGLITSGGNLVFNWTGQIGTVSSLSMDTADLDTLSAANNYFVGVYLTNVPSGFSALQLQIRIADVGAGGTCTGATMEAASNKNDYRIFTFETADAQVTFSGMNGATTGLPGGKTYCIGVANYSGSGQDTEGTFIRKSTKGPNFTGVYPTFIAALNQM